MGHNRLTIARVPEDQPGSADEAPFEVQAEVLDWEEELPLWLTPSNWPNLLMWDLPPHDIHSHPSAADVTYNTASFPALISTLSSLMRPKGDKPVSPRLLLAYKQRDEAERELWGSLEAIGIILRLIDIVPGAEQEGQVEIWVGDRSVMPDA